MAKELKLMKGNEAIARAMIASGTDGLFTCLTAFGIIDNDL